MPQTLLVVAAAMVLALFGLNRQRAIAADERAVVGREAEAAALATGERWAGIARDLAFDEGDVGALQMRLQGNVAGLSSRLGRETGETLADLATLDDVDDLAGLNVVEDAPVAGGVVSFSVTARAFYSVPRTWVDAPVGTLTTAKTVRIVVREVTGVAGGKTGRPAVEVTLPVRVSAALQHVHNR